ncbi:MAG TPA: acyl-CoA dehydrogenase family protein [Thermoleophilaceae bacterium]|nr:acyl-CoA dehydrogenase family protein [Thermoleophilaceae bacterium]
MNFDFTDDQQAIKRTARDLLADRFKPDTVRELAEAERYDEVHWREIAELGWAGIFVDEQHGGQGLGMVELAILAEELGYAVAPLPFLANAAAGIALQHAGSDAQRERWLPGIASGAQRGAAGLMRDGVAPLVPDADSASAIVLFENGAATVLEPSECEIAPIPSIDQTRRYARVTPRAGAGELLEGDAGPALDRIATLVGAEIVGVIQRTLEMAVEYARDRQQFGRPIGAYQGVSHRCADMLREVESSRSTVLWAAWAADSEPETLPLAAAMAKAQASDSGWNVPASALQVLGGIGFTWEHDLHFFLKRAKVDGALFGSAAEHRERVAELSGLGTSAATAV